MDAIGFFLSRYGDLHAGLVDGLLGKLPEAHLRARPHPGVNTVAWLLWHAARIEDVAVNRFLADRPQVLDDGWLERLGVARRDVGTGMSDAEVDELSARIDLQALRGYWDAVSARTLALVETLPRERPRSDGAGRARQERRPRGGRGCSRRRVAAPSSGPAAAPVRGSSPRRRSCTPMATTTRPCCGRALGRA